jgi:exodeoxyribonuclease VII large subunit
MESDAISAVEGIEASGLDLPGPYAVGDYVGKLQEEMRRRPRVLLIGEVTDFRLVRAQAYFELRDGEGAIPCAIWAVVLAKAGFGEEEMQDGVEVVIAGKPEYYPGGPQSSPRFAFRATHVRVAGEGDLLVRLAALREQLKAEGLFELQKQLTRRALPKTIGVVTAEAGAARTDLLASLARRGWAGTVVWGFAPVQDRHAAPAIAAAIQDLAARPEVDAIVVTRGGGSLADLWSFCDETLCRTVAMLRVPVISAIGHERDSTLIDDVAAVACSTPTHAAEAAVPIDCIAARRDLDRALISLRRAAEGAVGDEPHRRLIRGLGSLIRAGDGAVGATPYRRLYRSVSSLRRAADVADGPVGHRQLNRSLVSLRRTRDSVLGGTWGRIALRDWGSRLSRSSDAGLERRQTMLRHMGVTLRAFDSGAVLERGYALVEAEAGGPVSSTKEAIAAEKVKLRFADGSVGAKIEPGDGI